MTFWRKRMIPFTWEQLSIRVDLGELPLDAWEWLLPRGLCPLMVTPFGDVFFKDHIGETLFLDTISGELVLVQGGLDGLRARVGNGERLDELFRDELLTALLQRNVTLGDDECYQFIVPPMVSGTYVGDNVEVGPLALHLGLMGQLHAQMRILPEGAAIDRFVDADH